MSLPGLLRNLIGRRSHPATPEQWLVDFFGGGQTSHAGVNVNEYTALNYSAFYRAVAILSQSVGSLPLILYERQRPRGKQRAVDHPLYPILHDAPNPEMTAMVFRETLEGHLCTWGNAYAQIVRSRDDTVLQLWPLRPDRMKVRRTKACWSMSTTGTMAAPSSCLPRTFYTSRDSGSTA